MTELSVNRSRVFARLALVLLAFDILVAMAGGAIALILALDDSYEPFRPPDDIAGTLLISLTFALVGGLIALKRPGNVIGWALLLAGMLLYDFGQYYGELALLAKPDAGLPAGVHVAFLTAGSWVFIVNGIFLLLLLFPNGRLPSRRWRPLAIAVPVCLALVWPLLLLTFPTGEEPFQAFDNPFALTESDDYTFIAFPLIGICLFCMCAAGVHLIYRFWRSRGDEREQYKWLAFAAGLFVLTFPTQGIHPVVDIFGGLAFLALPVAVGIAVLRYRLYDIDIIINRTLVYVPLTAILAGLFVASTALVRTIFTDLTDTGSDMSVAASTLAVVAFLTPLKNRLQTLVDRYFKEQQDPFAAVRKRSAQAKSVIQVLDRERFVGTMLEELVTGLAAEAARVELNDGAWSLTAGTPGDTPVVAAPLVYKEDNIGTLLVWPGRSARAMRPTPDDLADTASTIAEVISLGQRSDALSPSGPPLEALRR